MSTVTSEANAPTFGLEKCPDVLTDAHKEQFDRDGYLAFAGILSDEEVEASRAALIELVDLCRSDKAEREGQFWRVSGRRVGIQFEKDYVPSPDADDLELKVRKVWLFVDDNEYLHEVSHNHPHIVGLLESLIGKEPILFQDMALVKPPFIGTEKPWHQDNAYFAVEPLDAVCGVWIALDDATVENGCMHVLPGGHKHGAFKHIHDRDCEIPLPKIDESLIRPVPIPAGGGMFFKGMLPHQTPPNSSPERRRALQFHYRSQDSRKVTREEYDVLYSELDEETGERVAASCSANPPGK